jgi:peptidoglycan/xylan/chitin deacetylase (PgdA/CDA1 family)
MHRDVAIILYHDIAEPVHPLAKHLGMSVTPDIFRQHVRYLAKNYDLISAGDLLSNNLPRKALLITFDDAYRSMLEYGAVILKEASAPAIFFGISATVAGPSIPLDNVISLAVEELGISRVLSLLELENREISSTAGLIAALLPELKTRDITVIKEKLFSSLGTTEELVHKNSHLFLDAGDVAELGKYRIAIGNHSMHHVFLRGLTDAELHCEICESRELLERISGQSVDYLAIPYGSELDATETVLQMARTSGHRGIFLVHARSNRFRPAANIYYRVDAGSGPAETLWRKLQVEPMLRTVRDWARRSRRRVSPIAEVVPAG